MQTESKKQKETPRYLQVLAGAFLAANAINMAPARADHALLIGVNTYPNLRQGSLMGCVNDATDMEAQLKKRGFTTTVLTNAQATKAGIVAALDSMKTRVKPNQRFVFFYAGHGTRSAGGGSSLLPTDAREGTEEFDLPAALLYDKLNAIPARSRTALLDSCFAGGMMRSKNLRKKITSRFYRRAITGSRAGEEANAKDLIMVKANRPNPTEHIEARPGPICYFVAAKGNEEAGEDDMPTGARRERHGIFTFHLLQEMNKLSDLRLPWNSISRPVISGVVDYMEDLQHPQLSTSYVETQIFESNQPIPAPVPTNTPTPAPTTTPTPVPTSTPTPAPEPPKTVAQLSMSIAPRTFSEGAGARAATGTITRNTSSTSALFITLSSSDTGQATVPAQLVIPRGQNSVKFVVAATDERIVDGPRQTVITANAVGFVGDAVTLTVNDNDVAPPPTPTPRPTLVPTPVPTLVPKPLETNLWDEFNGDHANPAKVLLLMEPDRSAVRIGEQFSFRAQIGAPGYLVIVERGTSDKINLIYPLSGKIGDAYLAGPARIPVDTEYAFEADALGNERLKAILFSSRERAEALLSKLPKPGSTTDNSFEGLSRDLKLVRVKVQPDSGFYTSDLMFAVLEKEGAKPQGLASPAN